MVRRHPGQDHGRASTEGKRVHKGGENNKSRWVSPQHAQRCRQRTPESAAATRGGPACHRPGATPNPTGHSEGKSLRLLAGSTRCPHLYGGTMPHHPAPKELVHCVHMPTKAAAPSYTNLLSPT